jgi:hypothetical protein
LIQKYCWVFRNSELRHAWTAPTDLVLQRVAVPRLVLVPVRVRRAPLTRVVLGRVVVEGVRRIRARCAGADGMGWPLARVLLVLR